MAIVAVDRSAEFSGTAVFARAHYDVPVAGALVRVGGGRLPPNH